jgi:hypothetical protein
MARAVLRRRPQGARLGVRLAPLVTWPAGLCRAKHMHCTGPVRVRAKWLIGAHRAALI